MLDFDATLWGLTHAPTSALDLDDYEEARPYSAREELRELRSFDDVAALLDAELS